MACGSRVGPTKLIETTLADDYTARYGANGKANVGRDHYALQEVILADDHFLDLVEDLFHQVHGFPLERRQAYRPRGVLDRHARRGRLAQE